MLPTCTCRYTYMYTNKCMHAHRHRLACISTYARIHCTALALPRLSPDIWWCMRVGLRAVMFAALRTSMCNRLVLFRSADKVPPDAVQDLRDMSVLHGVNLVGLRDGLGLRQLCALAGLQLSEDEVGHSVVLDLLDLPSADGGVQLRRTAGGGLCHTANHACVLLAHPPSLDLLAHFLKKGVARIDPVPRLARRDRVVDQLGAHPTSSGPFLRLQRVKAMVTHGMHTVARSFCIVCSAPKHCSNMCDAGA